jgi:outer membrane murein-binding lipoprotein Lpp
MILQKNNFGLTRQSIYAGYDDEGYDSLFKRFKEKRAEKKEERQTKKEDRKSERQEKRELNSEKKRLKNELKQTQIDEKKSQLSLLGQAGAPMPPGPPPGGGDNTMMIVAAVVGVIFIAGVGYVMMNKKQTPVVAPVFAKAA